MRFCCKKNSVIFLIFLIVILLITQTANKNCPDFNEAQAVIYGHTFKLGLAATPDRQSRGLGGCPKLTDKQGLYFVFDQREIRSFWMKDMLIPIDIIWLSDNRVIGLTANVQPPDKNSNTPLPTYQSAQPVNAVLELAAGQAQKYNIEIGTQLLMPGGL